MKSVTIDRSRHLADQPTTGHNRWHPDIPPIVEVEAWTRREACASGRSARRDLAA